MRTMSKKAWEKALREERYEALAISDGGSEGTVVLATNLNTGETLEVLVKGLWYEAE